MCAIAFPRFIRRSETNFVSYKGYSPEKSPIALGKIRDAFTPEISGRQ